MARDESDQYPTGGEGQPLPRWAPGPVTLAAFGADKGRPPRICEEWNRIFKLPGEFILVWAGAYKAAGERSATSWSWITERCSSPGEDPTAEGEEEESGARPESPDLAAKVERMLSPLAHESRVRILQALYESPKSSTELSEATGLKGGNLYHHLRDLLNSAYVCEKEPGYGLTDLGRQLLITFTCIASQAVQDRDREGLVIGGHG